MRMIPPRPPDSATGSERKIFELLQRDPQTEAVALTSLNLSEHEYQRWGELDFVVVEPQGLMVVEVKGGQVTCANGLWRFEDRWGRRIEKATAPLAQAQGGYSSLANRFIKPKFGGSFLGASGFCTVFPGTKKVHGGALTGGTENPPPLVGFEEDCRNGNSFRSFLDLAFGFWRTRLAKRSPNWTVAQIREVVAALRPSFDRVQPLSLSLARLRQEQLELTEEQYRLLDYMEDVDRLVCTGAAGTGKTFLAVECMRRTPAATTVLVTGTDYLAEHLRGENVPDPQRIMSYWEVEANAAALRGRFDTLIVDEGQQVTNHPCLQVLSSLLRRPFAESRWRWFTDPHHQLSSTSRFDQSTHDEITNMANVATRLRENCRNTAQIVRAVEYATGVALGSTRVRGAGPDIVYGQADTWDGLSREAATQIQTWLDDGEVSPGEVMLLSPGPVSGSQIPEIARHLQLPYQRWRRGWNRAASSLGACTVEEFRGLESPFVVLCNVVGTVEQLATVLYLGMTRANYGVFVACDKGSRAQLVAARTRIPAQGA